MSRYAMNNLTLLEHASADYRPRTIENAKSADMTIAIAVDFYTSGERLTRTAAEQHSGLYLPIPLAPNWSAPEAMGSVVAEMMKQVEKRTRKKVRVLNVAGNGMYTIGRHFGKSQLEVNVWVFKMLRQLHTEHPLAGVRSGGQTGVDFAALVAGVALGIPTTGLFPKGFRQRDIKGRDVRHGNEDAVRSLIDFQLAGLEFRLTKESK